MLKTLGIKSAEPRKSVVKVDGGGRNRAEPIGKHKFDSNKSISCSSDFDKRFHPKLHGDFKVTFRITCWRSGLCSSVMTIAFDYASEADHEKSISVALD